MRPSLRICALPGDGIGPEVTSAALDVLQAALAPLGVQLTVESHPIGAAALRQAGSALPAATRAAALRSDAVLLGAVGDPEFDLLPMRGQPEAGLLELRRALGVYANLRPAAFVETLAHASPLRRERVHGADLVIVRELLGGAYFGEPRSRIGSGAGEEAVDTTRYSRSEIERIARRAFDLARTRRRRLASVDKSNVLETSRLWRDVVNEVARHYPDVEVEHVLVDACAMRLVTRPTSFDVILTENLFGDILSDEAAVLFGSLGVLPSASLGGGPGLFEPVHGSAPELTGRDVANPAAAILSAALLLEHTGAPSQGFYAHAARSIRAAVEAAWSSGIVTRDIAGPGQPHVGTREFTRAVVQRLSRTAQLKPCWMYA